MARKKGAETLVEFWRSSFTNHLFSLAIIMLSLLMLTLSSCARGGGTPIPIVEQQQEAGVLIDSATTPAVETGPPPAQPICGNGKLEPEIGEECDLGDLGGATCASLSAGQEEGDLSCTQDCRFNTIMCYVVISGAGSGAEDPAAAGSYGAP